MASSPEVVLPVEVKHSIDEKKAPIATDLELVPSEKDGEVEVVSEADYTPEQYKQVLRKIDRYLLPLMWFCYGEIKSLNMLADHKTKTSYKVYNKRTRLL